ncbi:MAG TPA: beta-galactosidase GalA [Novosphingobium sp.]|nr:beta-galactosidase GalA [Novosphingobium sp.]
MLPLRRRAVLAGSLAAGAAMGAAPLARAALPSAGPVLRRATRLAEGWRFHLGHASDPARDFGFGAWQRSFAKPGAELTSAAAADFDDSGWEAVSVPHDWAAGLPYAPPAQVPKGKEDFAAAHGFRAIGRDFPGHSVGWYRLKLPLGKADRGRAVWLEFDGVFRASMVIVNGYHAGGSTSGYAPFRVDIADFLNDDDTPNQLVVRVDASLGEGWFYEGAGIYRHVTLVSAAAQHVPQWGVCVRASPRGTGAEVAVATDITNAAAHPAMVALRQRVIAADGQVVAESESAPAPLAAGAATTLAQALAFPAARLWSPEDPALYRLETTVLTDGTPVDRVETRFGVRSLRFSGREGFVLNGRPVKLKGVCNHQDHAGVGTAIPDALHAWRLGVMREMGANAWRSAHNPPAEALLDLCDAQGMMMIAETRLNTTSPEGMDELDRMILSARNHPSVILWSVGNEEGHQGTPRGARLSAGLVARARALDPTRQTTQAMDSGWYEEGAARVVDVVGFNYRTDQIPAFKAKYPDVPVIGTETASTVATRGAYANDPAAHVVRAYDTEHPWWAANAEGWWPIVAANPGIAGGFIWTGFDYRGEPTPYPAWPSVSSYFGVVDICGFPKDNYHYYRAWWRPDLPQVHLLPHWTWPGREGQPIEVWAHGNCAAVELVLNGRGLGRQAMPANGHLVWQVPYAAGVLEARGLDAAGRLVAQDSRATAGAPAGVRLLASKPRLAADGADVAVIRAEICDAAGRPVPTARTRLDFALEGPARLLGTGNGNPTDTTPDHAASRPAFNGLAQAIVQSTGATGAIQLAVSGEGVAPARLSLFAHAL